jgi:hypothetical protein
MQWPKPVNSSTLVFCRGELAMPVVNRSSSANFAEEVVDLTAQDFGLFR